VISSRKLAGQVRDRRNPLEWEGLKAVSALGDWLGWTLLGG
jgi:hypothetical protein